MERAVSSRTRGRGFYIGGIMVNDGERRQRSLEVPSVAASSGAWACHLTTWCRSDRLTVAGETILDE